MAQGIPSKATITLLTEGITVTRIAREIGITKAAVSAHLNGVTNSMSPDLLNWIEANLEPDLALEVIDGVKRARAARQEASA